MADHMNDVAAGDVNAARARTVPGAFDGGTGVVSPPHPRVDGDKGGSLDGIVSIETNVRDLSVIGIPKSLREMIRRSVQDALDVTFHRDPTFDPGLSRLVSVAASMQRRHGHILLEAMALGLEAGGHVTVEREGAIRRIDVCPTARRATRKLAPEACAELDLGYDAARESAHEQTAGPRVVEVDAIVIDRRDGSALAIESKRGAKVGAPVLRQLIESTSVVSLLLRSHLARHGQSVTRGDAVVLVQHADRGLVLPDGLGTTLAALDRRYEAQAERMVAAATALHARLVRQALGDLLERAACEATDAGSTRRGCAAVTARRRAVTKANATVAARAA